MAKILKTVNHVPDMKKKAMQQTAIWIGIMLLLFVVGLILNSGERRNVFTIIAVLCALPIGQILSTFFGYSVAKNWNDQLYEDVKKLPDCANVYLNCIAVTDKKQLYFDYIIITGENIYIFAREASITQNDLAALESYCLKKGIDCPVTIAYETEWQQVLESLKNINECTMSDFCIKAFSNLLM